MMNYGLEFRNSDGAIIADGEYRNHFLSRVIKTSRNFQPIDYGGQRLYEYSPQRINFSPIKTQDPPIVFAFGANHGIVWTPVIGEPGNWHSVDVTVGLDFDEARDGAKGKSVAFEIFVYAAGVEDAISLGGNYGVQIFENSSRLTFDSRFRPFVVKNLRNVPVVERTGPREEFGEIVSQLLPDELPSQSVCLSTWESESPNYSRRGMAGAIKNGNGIAICNLCIKSRRERGSDSFNGGYQTTLPSRPGPAGGTGAGRTQTTSVQGYALAGGMLYLTAKYPKI